MKGCTWWGAGGACRRLHRLVDGRGMHSGLPLTPTFRRPTCTSSSRVGEEVAVAERWRRWKSPRARRVRSFFLLKQLSDVLAQLRLEPLRLGEEPLRLGDAIREALADRVDVGLEPLAPVGEGPFLLHSLQPVPPRSQGGNGLLVGVVPPDVIPLAT